MPNTQNVKHQSNRVLTHFCCSTVTVSVQLKVAILTSETIKFLSFCYLNIFQKCKNQKDWRHFFKYNYVNDTAANFTFSSQTNLKLLNCSDIFPKMRQCSFVFCPLSLAHICFSVEDRTSRTSVLTRFISFGRKVNYRRTQRRKVSLVVDSFGSSQTEASTA